MRPRHVPMRSCVVCRKKVPKRELFRILRTPEGVVHLDTAGKAPGRGAYLCGSRACWELALKGKQMNRALRGPVSPADMDQLRVLATSMQPGHQPTPQETS